MTPAWWTRYKSRKARGRRDDAIVREMIDRAERWIAEAAQVGLSVVQVDVALMKNGIEGKEDRSFGRGAQAKIVMEYKVIDREGPYSKTVNRWEYYLKENKYRRGPLT